MYFSDRTSDSLSFPIGNQRNKIILPRSFQSCIILSWSFTSLRNQNKIWTTTTFRNMKSSESWITWWEQRDKFKLLLRFHSRILFFQSWFSAFFFLHPDFLFQLRFFGHLLSCSFLFDFCFRVGVFHDYLNNGFVPFTCVTGPLSNRYVGTGGSFLIECCMACEVPSWHWLDTTLQAHLEKDKHRIANERKGNKWLGFLIHRVWFSPF